MTPTPDDAKRAPPPQPASTGIAGLDDILRGGLPAGRLYPIEGTPGAGKTTLALQFLRAGVAAGEPVLYVTLSETREEIGAIAAAHGWSMEGITIHEMTATADDLSPDAQMTMFHPSELELGETTRVVLDRVERESPRRVVFDSMSELRLLAQTALRYRRQILGLKQFFAGRGTSVLLLDDQTAPGEDQQVRSIAHGVVQLEQVSTGYGSERRRMRVVKMRGVGFRGGHHDYVIRRGGLDVFPRLVAAEHRVPFASDEVSTGNAGLDGLLCGGLPPGTSTLLLGPSGAGKSTVAAQIALAVAGRGDRVAMFIFDEVEATLRARCRKLGMPLDELIAAGRVTVQQVDPAELSPGEFAATVRRAVEGTDTTAGPGGSTGRPAKAVVIDSLNGYLHSMPDEMALTAQLHELFTYNNQQGVSTLLTVTQAGMIDSMRSPIDTTYLADNVIMFRYFEAHGRIRRAISVVKKRSGRHESNLRELVLGPVGINIGKPLTDFQGVLTGVPTYVGGTAELMAPATGAGGTDAR
jgi:circadian clock protein KaiC